jgi:hypothetical protein
MAFEPVEFVEKHPYTTAAVAGGVVLLFVILSMRGSSGGATASSGVDPVTAQLYAQTQQLQASGQAQSAKYASDQNLATIEAGYGLSLAQIQTNAQSHQTDTAASATLAGIAAQSDVQKTAIAATLQEQQNQTVVQNNQINAQLAALQDTNATSAFIAQNAANEQLGIANLTAGTQRDIAAITGQTQLGIANLTSQTQLGISNNQSQVAIAQSNNQKNIAQSGQQSNLFGQIAGGVMGLLSAAFL